MSIRTYSELMALDTFKERYEYLKLGGVVGGTTFGYDRYINQRFYESREWARIRDLVITRDNGCDLAISDRILYGKILIHHMNPISLSDIIDYTETLREPEFLICVSHETHNAIHYGNADLLVTQFIERTKNDTCPWRR